MKLANLIDPRLVSLNADVANLDEAVELALHHITDLYKHELRYEPVLARVQDRVRLGGIVFPTGVAIPHARLPDFQDFIIAAVVPKVPFSATETKGDSADAKPVSLVWLILISHSVSSVYLNTLAKLIEASKNDALMAALRTAEAGTQFVDLIDKAGFEVKKDLVVADLMTKKVVSIQETASVKELIDLMYEKKLRYIPIVNAESRLVGELGVLDLIKAGIPDYAFRVGSLKFLAELEPMTELLLSEDKIPVKDIMHKADSSVEPDTSVVEVAFEMARSKKRHFPVVKGGELVGVISAMDILNKVLRA